MKNREDTDRKLTIGFYKMIDLSDLCILLLFVIIMVILLLIANTHIALKPRYCSKCLTGFV